MIEEAKEKMVFVSPYYHITKWTKLVHCLDKMRRRNVAAEFYVREDATECIAEVKEAGFHPNLIKRLHTKLYFNERHAIISSMNLDFRSDNQSLDIALITENEGEYKDVMEHFEQFIKREVIEAPSSATHSPQQYFNWKSELDTRLEASLKRDVYIKNFSDAIQVQAGNRYEAFIGNEFGNELFLSGILSNKEYLFAKANKVFQSNKLAIYLEEGGQRGKSYVYDQVCGRMSRLKSRSIHNLHADEQELIVDTIHRFIVGVETLKGMVR